VLALVTALPASAPAGETADVGVAAAGTVPVWRTTTAVGPGVHAATVRLPAGGRLRTAIVLTPRTARPVPLLLVLHGRDTTPAEELVRTGFAELAAHGDAVLAYPAGVGQS
jgi:poly(3-hydroxybutyrate) depolymerase